MIEFLQYVSTRLQAKSIEFVAVEGCKLAHIAKISVRRSFGEFSHIAVSLPELAAAEERPWTLRSRAC